MCNATFYPLSPGDSLTRWRDRLHQAGGLVADPVQQLRLHFYDSFDGRLLRAGRILEQEQGPDGAELRLRACVSQQVEAALPLNGPMPRFASLLAAGELRRRLQEHLAPRALLPLAGVRLRRYNLRAVDDEGKTRVWVQIESLSLLRPGARARLLSKRLCVQPLRGYAKAAQRIISRLENDHGLRPREEDWCALVLDAAGNHPLHSRPAPVVSLSARMRADLAARRVLQAQFATMQAQEPGLIANLDSEFLHDFRIALRRSRSLLLAMKQLFPPSVLGRFKDDFAWLSAVTGKARDLDVYLLNFPGYRRAIPAGLRVGLEPLRALLQSRQQQTYAEQLVVALHSRRYRAFKQRWQRYLDSPLARRPTAPEAAERLDVVARRRSWRRYRRILRQGAKIDAGSPAEDLHSLRKACKKLRYLLEAFASLYPPDDIQAVIKALKKLQKNLGEIQDLEVQLVSLKGFAMEIRRRGEYNASTAAAVDALLEVLRRRRSQAREDFDARFRRFANGHNQALFRRLLKPGAAQVPV